MCLKEVYIVSTKVTVTHIFFFKNTPISKKKYIKNLD